jgi:hypothetical protein
MMVMGGIFSLSQNLIHLHLSSNYTFTSGHVSVNEKKHFPHVKLSVIIIFT